MVNSEDFIKRLEKIMRYYNLSASVLADKIDVQRSSISHLLSGRNKPSLEFVMKLIKSFPEVNLYWLLNGKGSFPFLGETASASIAPSSTETTNTAPSKNIKKVIIFYSDGSFETYDKN